MPWIKVDEGFMDSVRKSRDMLAEIRYAWANYAAVGDWASIVAKCEKVEEELNLALRDNKMEFETTETQSRKLEKAREAMRRIEEELGFTSNKEAANIIKDPPEIKFTVTFIFPKGNRDLGELDIPSSTVGMSPEQIALFREGQAINLRGIVSGNGLWFIDDIGHSIYPDDYHNVVIKLIRRRKIR